MKYNIFALILILTLGFWVEAKDLREGDVFLGGHGELSTLVATERVVFPDCIRVYNFTVDGNHDYFVIAATDEYGQTCVLVHNSRKCLWEILPNERRPKYVVNVEHVKLRYNNKTALPKDAEDVFNGTLLSHKDYPRVFYARGENGVYRFTTDHNDEAHFTGIVDLIKDTWVPSAIRRAFQ